MREYSDAVTEANQPDENVDHNGIPANVTQQLRKKDLRFNFGDYFNCFREARHRLTISNS